MLPVTDHLLEHAFSELLPRIVPRLARLDFGEDWGRSRRSVDVAAFDMLSPLSPFSLSMAQLSN